MVGHPSRSTARRMTSPTPSTPAAATGVLGTWSRLPLYTRILIGLLLGLIVGYLLGPSAKPLDWPARLVLRVLGGLAPALILVAVVRALITAEIHGRLALRMAGLLLLNTVMAILIGLTVANVLRPGVGQQHGDPTTAAFPMR